MNSSPMTFAIMTTLGVLMVIASGIIGFFAAFLLSGVGICAGVPLDWSLFFVTVATTAFPVATGGLFRRGWWIGAAAYSLYLGIPIWIGIVLREWMKGAAALCCVGIAFYGAWLFRRKPPRTNR